MSPNKELIPEVFISIIIPAFNEEQRIGKTLDQYLRKYEGRGEVIVILNGCHDHTLEAVRGFQQNFSKCLKWIDIPERVGKGGAVIRGFEIARGRLIGFVDADGSTSAQDFDHLVEQIGAYGGVIASRFIEGARAERSFIRVLVGKGFHLITKVLFWLPFEDTQCGAKVFREEVIRSVLPQLRCRDMVFDVDLLYHVLKGGDRVKEVPTLWTEEKHSALFSSNRRLLHICLSMFFSLMRLRIRTLLEKN